MKPSFLFIFCILLLALISGISAQNDAVDKDVFEFASIVEEDVCAPPCFFGVVAGESTAEQVVGNLSEYIPNWCCHPKKSVFGYEEIDETTGYVIYGGYSIRFGARDLGAALYINKGILSHIVISARERIITVGDVLAKMGTPDQIRIWTGWEPQLKFIYLEPRVVIQFVAYNRDKCTLATLMTDYQVDIAYYYSHDYAYELVETSAFTANLEPRTPEQQPRILLYRTYGEERVVSPEIWDTWLAGEVEQPCGSAWRLVPFEEVFPDNLDELMNKEEDSNDAE